MKWRFFTIATGVAKQGLGAITLAQLPQMRVLTRWQAASKDAEEAQRMQEPCARRVFFVFESHPVGSQGSLGTATQADQPKRIAPDKQPQGHSQANHVLQLALTRMESASVDQLNLAGANPNLRMGIAGAADGPRDRGG